MSKKPQPESRAAYACFESITTRWSDNDAYGHVNNVVYYNWFDTAVNAWLIRQGVLDIHAGAVIGLVVQTQCNYFAPLAFPQNVEIGLRVAHMGNASVRFELGVFAAGAATSAAAGHFVHVFVDRSSRSSISMPAELRAALNTLFIQSPLTSSLTSSPTSSPK